MTDRSSPALRVLGPRAVLQGANDSLENVATETLPDGSLCWVTAEAKRYGFRRGSTASPSPPTIIAPAIGPGRWVQEAGGGSITIPFPVADIDATSIADGKIIVASGGIATWGDVPVAFDITGFAHSPTLVQVGATVTNPAFTASYNQAATSASLTDTESHNDALTLPATGFVSPHAFTKTVFGQSVTFTLHAASALGTDTAAVSIAWGENVYYGAVNDPGTYNEAFIESLTPALRLSPSGSYGFNAGGSQSSFFCALTSLGLTINSFFVGGFPFACSKVASAVSVTNTNGVTETYDVFRSDNVGLAAFTLTVA
jgi:hypothetical protein